MGSFGYNRWNPATLRNQKLVHQEESPGQLVSRRMQKLSEEMANSGTQSEQRILSQFLRDFKAILPRKLSTERALVYVNLLHGFVDFWALGKRESEGEARAEYHRRIREVNPNADPKAEELFRFADALNIEREKVREQKKAWNGRLKKKSGEWTLRLPDENLDQPVRAYRFPDEELKRPMRTKLLRGANEIGHFFSEDEFKEKDIYLESTYDNRRSKLNRKGKTRHAVADSSPGIG